MYTVTIKANKEEYSFSDKESAMHAAEQLIFCKECSRERVAVYDNGDLIRVFPTVHYFMGVSGA